jgi:membrane protease YdiL (CAAX protease family)
MRRWILGLSDRAELVLVTALCFSYFVLSSGFVLLSGVHRIDLTSGRVTQGIVIELFILVLAGAVLKVRGWAKGRLGLTFSWGQAAAGVPVFILYLLLYWMTATLVLMVWPRALNVWAFHYSMTAPFSLMTLFIVLNSFFEETTVTAYVITSLSRQGAAVAITASTLLRFAYHLYQGPLGAISVIPAGLVFGAMYWRSRNVWPLIVAHSIANLVALAVNPQHGG